MHARSVVCVVLYAALFCLSSCTVTLPKDFVQLGSAGEGTRAVTSDDARLWVRDLWDATPGSVDFWIQTLENDYVERGYEVLGRGEVKSRDGEVGRSLELVANVSGQRVGYFVALWVGRHWLYSGSELRVVEFAAREAVYAARIDSIRAAMADLR